MKKYLKLLIIAVVLGAFLAYFRAGFFVFALFALSAYCIYRFVQTPSKSFLLKLFIFGFILRVLFSLVNHELGFIGPYKSVDTQADAVIFNGNAFYIAYVLRDGNFPEKSAGALKKDPFLKHSIEKGYDNFSGHLPSMRKHQYNFYTFLLGIFYACLGYGPIAAKILNGLFACLSAIWVYFIARILTGSETTAKISAALVMFFPSLIYWSVTLLQDSLVNSFFLLYVLFFLIYLVRGKASSLLLFFIACLALSLLKTKILSVFWIWLAIAFVMQSTKNIIKKGILTKTTALISITAILIAAAYFNRCAIVDYIERNVNFIFDYLQATMKYHPSASFFKIYDDIMYTGPVDLHIKDIFNFTFAFSAVKASLYYFLLPFPWRIPYSHLFLLPFYPQVIFTFICIPFALLGMVTSIRRKPYIALTLGLMLLSIIVPQAMAECIIGNVVRHRDMFMPFVMIFSSYGFYLAILPKDKTDQVPR